MHTSDLGPCVYHIHIRIHISPIVHCLQILSSLFRPFHLPVSILSAALPPLSITTSSSASYTSHSCTYLHPHEPAAFASLLTWTHEPNAPHVVTCRCRLSMLLSFCEWLYWPASPPPGWLQTCGPHEACPLEENSAATEGMMVSVGSQCEHGSSV